MGSISDIEIVRSQLILPDNVTDSTDEWDPRRAVDECVDFRRALRRIDSRLDLIYVKRGARNFPIGNRWYIVRRAEHHPDQFWVIQDENGEYCEPDERHFQRFVEGDTASHPDVYRRIRRKREEAALRVEKVIEAKRDEFRTKLGERLAHIFDTQIAITGTHKELAEGRHAGKKPPPPSPRRKGRRHGR